MHRKVVPLTFTKVSYPFSVDRVTVLVHVRDQEIAEMSDDRPANALCDDPLHDGLGFDIAELFHWQFLQQVSDEGSYGVAGYPHIVDPIHIIHVSPFIILPSRSAFHP